MKQKTLMDKLTNFTESNISESTYLTHGIHPYPAKYIPQLPKEIILANSKERNTILDPFCGSGTTLLEACLNGRKSIGIDSNPIAALISAAKTQFLTEEELHNIESIIEELLLLDFKNINRIDSEVPNEKNLHHWFCEIAITELSWLKNYIYLKSQGNLKQFLLCIFSSIIVNVSNQESDTRYAAKPKSLEIGSVIVKFVRKLSNQYERIKEISSNCKVKKNTPIIYNKDSREITSAIIPDNSIDLIVTSPPYPNSYDYYLYHKWRMIWLGFNFKNVKELEIGSRNEHSSKKEPIETFENKMIPILTNVSRVLKPNKLAYFFIGDSIISGEFIDMSESFRQLAEKSNLKFVSSNKYDLDKISRYFYEKRTSSNKNKHQKMQHIIVFEPFNNKKIYLNTENIKSQKNNEVIAKVNSDYKKIILGKDTITDKSIVSIVDSKKNSTIHSLGKYPAKFIPEIPRWAIKNYSRKGDNILDPFNGSGTTVTEAILLERNGYGIDISPYACLITKSKTAVVNVEDIKLQCENLIKLLNQKVITSAITRKNFKNDTFWFDELYLNQIELIKTIIDENFKKNIKEFFYGVLATVIKPCSYLDESQIKVKRDHKKLLNGTKSPIELMKKNLLKYSESLIEFNRCLTKNVDINIFNDTILNCNKLIKKNSIDLIVTSPPYINAMNYPMNHRYENILLGLLNPEDSIKHQTKYIGTERVYSDEYRKLCQFDEKSILGKQLNDKLKKIYELEPKRSYIVYKYFCEMNEAFKSIYDVLKPGGTIVIVAGTNTIRGVYIDTFDILVKMLKDINLKYELSFHYEIVKNALKINRHTSSDIIKFDGIAILKKGE